MRKSSNSGGVDMTSYADLMTNLFFVVVVVMFLSLVQVVNRISEVFTEVDLFRAPETPQAKAAQPGENAAYLSVARSGKLVLEVPSGQAPRRFSSIEALERELARSRPSELYLRVDQAVPTGTTQALLVLCQRLGILAYLAMEEAGPERRTLP